MCIQLEHKVGVGWEFIILPDTTFCHPALGVPGPINGVEDKGSIKHLFFVYVPICEVTDLIK